MRQVLLTISLVGFVFIALGCREPAEPRPHADVALEGLMPAGDPGMEMAYLADQTKVTTLPKREIPEGSLLSIATLPKSKSEMEAMPSAPAAAPTRAAVAPAAGHSDGNFWNKIGEKTLGSVLWGNAAKRAAAADQDDDADDDDDANYEEEDSEAEDED